jgi:hypothetical protein
VLGLVGFVVPLIDFNKLCKNAWPKPCCLVEEEILKGF